ncbi:MAG: hypothetical protein ACREU6_14625 [Steroidobacteraceae bacterium]
MPWLLPKTGPGDAQGLRDRVSAELTATSASPAGATPLAETLSPGAIAACNKRATGEKYLITPNNRVV